MREDERREERLAEESETEGPRRNHGDVNEELVPGAPRSPIREERARDPRERPGEKG
jgi:hypothetical protein